jgi:microcystin-dependent protein
MNTVLKIITLFIFLNHLTLQAQDALKIEENGNVIVSQNLDVKGRIQQNGNDLLPSGAIIMWYGGSTAPAGWVMCDGSLYTLNDGKYTKVPKENEAQYKDKNGTITTPDLRNRFIVGAGDQYKAKDIGGINEVTLTTDQMPKHAHSISTQNGKLMGDGVYERNDFRDGGNFKGFDRGNAGIVDASGITEWVGGNQPHENRPPYYALYYIMKL